MVFLRLSFVPACIEVAFSGFGQSVDSVLRCRWWLVAWVVFLCLGFALVPWGRISERLPDELYRLGEP